MTDGASAQGVNVSTTQTELHLHLREDGSARWEARVGLDGEGVDTLRGNESLRTALVERRLANDSGPAPAEPRNLSVTMAGDTLVVAFDDPGLADRHAGTVLVVDRFHYRSDPTPTPPFELRADRMVLHPPEGWIVQRNPPGATVEAGSVVWTDGVVEDTYVVVGPDGSTGTSARGEVAVAAEVASWAVGPWIGATVFPVLVLGSLVLVLLGRVRAEPPLAVVGRSNRTLLSRLAGSFLVLGAAIAGVVLAHGGVLADGTVALAVFVGVQGVVFVGLGAVAHRRPAVRWPTAVVALGFPSIVSLWFVLSEGGGVSATLGSGAWAVVMAILGTGAFIVGRDTAVPPDKRPAVEPPVVDEPDEPTERGDGHKAEGK